MSSLFDKALQVQKLLTNKYNLNISLREEQKKAKANKNELKENKCVT